MAIDDQAGERVNAMLRDMAPLEEEPTWTDVRRAVAAMYAKFPLADDLQVERVDADGIPCLWVDAPGVSSERALLYLHGGGYLMGSAMESRDIAYRMAKACDARVLVVDYRLAPEHPFPAGLDDARTAFRWLKGHYEPAQIAFAGDSAGGAMAIAVCMATRDEGGALPAALGLFSPFIDLAAEGDSYFSNVGSDVYIQRDIVVGNGLVYLEGADPKENPLASPLYADDFSGLPPMIASAGADELLLSDSPTLVEKVQAAGGEAELDIVADMQHIFPIFACVLPEGRATIAKTGEFIKARLGAAEPARS